MQLVKKIYEIIDIEFITQLIFVQILKVKKIWFIKIFYIIIKSVWVAINHKLDEESNFLLVEHPKVEILCKKIKIKYCFSGGTFLKNIFKTESTKISF